MKKIITRKVPENIVPLHQHPLLHRIYAARGVVDAKELEYDLRNLLPFDQLLGIEEAIKILVTALKKQQHVLVVGDFDTDGATSTALAILVLKAFGLKQVSYLIPDRFKYGYGLTPEIVATAAELKPDLIVTVDNGIASIDGVIAAHEKGIKVVITDHHLPGDDLPEADAIVNPVQSGDEFASKSLAGVGVIFYLMLGLRAHLRDIAWFKEQNIAEPNMAQFLDLVALGTVADAVALDFNNRILVAQGLEIIRSGKSRPGIMALFTISKRYHAKALAHDLGFVIAPRLNAAGRLDDMALGVECLLTDDQVRAQLIAGELNLLNNERRIIEQDMQQQAERIIENLKIDQDLPSGLSIFEESWHQGVLGILAGRLKDKLHRPVVVFTAVNENDLKGSARSVGNVHIRDLLNNIAVKNPGLITRFGGHAMAAGLSLKREDYETFSESFAKEVSRFLSQDDLSGAVDTDGGLAAEYFNLETAELLNDAGPWGAGFSEPLFFGEFDLIKQQLVGTKHLKLVLRYVDGKQDIAGICFNIDVNCWPNSNCSKAKIVYRLSVNEYNGRRSLQLMINEIMG